MTRKSLLHALAEHNVGLSEQDTQKLMEAYDSLSPFPDVNPALKRLENSPNIECVVFSNGTKSMVTNSVHKAHNLNTSVFKDLITVDFVRAFKPAPEVYKFLAQKVDRVGHESRLWLVSSNPFDVVGARACGLRVAWVDRTGHGWQDELAQGPTVIVNSLGEVVDFLQKNAGAIISQ